MGGLGSGRRYRAGTHATTDEYRSIDIRHWHRDGMLDFPQSFRWSWRLADKVVCSVDVRAEPPDRMVLRHSHRGIGGIGQERCYPVDLNWSECHLGGYRPWFICPADGCGRRVAILYLGGIFGCRHCYRLVYACQREEPDDRALRRAYAIRDRLGWEPRIFHAHGHRPKGMHWRKFEALVDAHDTFIEKSRSDFSLRYGINL